MPLVEEHSVEGQMRLIDGIMSQANTQNTKAMAAIRDAENTPPDFFFLNDVEKEKTRTKRV